MRGSASLSRNPHTRLNPSRTRPRRPRIRTPSARSGSLGCSPNRTNLREMRLVHEESSYADASLRPSPSGSLALRDRSCWVRYPPCMEPWFARPKLRRIPGSDPRTGRTRSDRENGRRILRRTACRQVNDAKTRGGSPHSSMFPFAQWGVAPKKHLRAPAIWQPGPCSEPCTPHPGSQEQASTDCTQCAAMTHSIRCTLTQIVDKSGHTKPLRHAVALEKDASELCGGRRLPAGRLARPSR